MGEETKIQWCDHTFNPWIGCTKVSPGCANCYAEVSTPSRVRGVKWGKGQARQRTSESNWKEPRRWNRAAGSKLQRPRVFCASLSDWLDDEVPIEWLADLLRLIHETPNIDWLLLTKRPENFSWRIANVLADYLNTPEFRELWNWSDGWITGERIPSNVWIGATAEDQERADERVKHLVAIPARVRFLSVEPMIDAVDLHYSSFNGADSFGQIPGIDWVIVGGESGAGARPCKVWWIRDVVNQCRRADVACFVKQLGAKVVTDNANFDDWPDDVRIVAGGEGFAAGRVVLNNAKGGDPSEWPDGLRVREFPKA